MKEMVGQEFVGKSSSSIRYSLSFVLGFDVINGRNRNHPKSKSGIAGVVLV